MIIPALLVLIAIVVIFFLSYTYLIHEKKGYEEKPGDNKNPLEKVPPPAATTPAPWQNDPAEIIKTLAEGLIVLDSSLNPKIVNEAAHALLPIDREFHGFTDIAKIFPLGVNLEEKVREALTTDKPVTLHEVLINNRTFQIFITPLSPMNVSFENNTNRYVTGVSILFQDLSSEKANQKVKDEFQHMVVHDLRAPVVAIKDTAALLNSGRLGAQDHKNMLNLIYEQSNKLLSQISTILDAAKLSDGKLVLTKNPGDISTVVQEVMALFMPQTKRKNITMIAEIGNELPVVHFDKLRITEVLNNILSNSLKYTNEGGVIKITVDTDDNYHKASLDGNEKGNIVITISDNGIGIPEDKQSILFTKFGQANLPQNAEVQKTSTGLGLFITKGIIEAHHGTISVSSKVGQGTTTTITLPIKTNDRQSLEDQEKAAGLPPHPVLS